MSWRELLDYLHCLWAEREIDPRHNDVVKVQTTIINFEFKYGKSWRSLFKFGKNVQPRLRIPTRTAKTPTRYPRRMAGICFYPRNIVVQVVDYLRQYGRLVQAQFPRNKGGSLS